MARSVLRSTRSPSGSVEKDFFTWQRLPLASRASKVRSSTCARTFCGRRALKRRRSRPKLPRGCQPIEETYLQRLRQIMEAASIGGKQVELVQVYSDERTGLGVVLSLVHDLRANRRALPVGEVYHQSLIEAYGAQNVRVRDYIINDVYVKNFVVQNSVNLRLQLLCLRDADRAVELQFVVPRRAYEELRASVESSTSKPHHAALAVSLFPEATSSTAPGFFICSIDTMSTPTGTVCSAIPA